MEEARVTRVVKEYDERHQEFLDAAQRLFYERSYEGTSVQAIIEAVGVAKGTFYHYFDSKGDLLNALTERMLEAAIERLEPMVSDPTRDAVSKLEAYFASESHWKATNQEILLALLHVLYRDENVLLRVKLQDLTIRRATPLLARVIRQGCEEGLFRVDDPEETAEIVLRMGQGLSEATGQLILAGARGEAVVQRMARKLAAFERGVERTLGLTERQLSLIDLEDIRLWFAGESSRPDVGPADRLEQRTK